MRFTELSLAAQTAYAELAGQTRALEINSALSGLSGSFQKLDRKGVTPWVAGRDGRRGHVKAGRPCSNLRPSCWRNGPLEGMTSEPVRRVN